MAKFSPSGKYIASGDNSGKVRVWSWTHPDKLLKNEAMVFAGEVEDLAWDGESKRILAVGGGQAKARFFLAETGTCIRSSRARCAYPLTPQHQPHPGPAFPLPHRQQLGRSDPPVQESLDC